MTGSIEPFDW